MKSYEYDKYIVEYLERKYKNYLDHKNCRPE